jgi:DNA invertase Pin-like site-specific DNA recombinase
LAKVYSDGGGLYLRARDSGRSWFYIGMLHGKRLEMGLGSVLDIPLTSAAGKMTMAVIAAVAEFERDLLIERTQAGLVRAKARGKNLGRPDSLTPEQQAMVARQRSEGVSLGVLAKELGVSRSAIQRVQRS